MDARTLESRMDAAVGTMRAASADLLGSIVPYDRERRWKAAGATSMSAWLSARYREPRSTTREWVRVAWALDELPLISDAYTRRRLSWCQVRFVSRFAAPEDDAHWAQRARSMSPAHLLFEAQRRERAGARTAHDAHRRRGVTTWWDEKTSMFNLHARYGADQGARVERELARRADQVPKDEDAKRPGAARMADALAEALTASRAGGGTVPVALVVHADATALAQEQPSRDGTAMHTGLGVGPTRGAERIPDATGADLAETESGRRLAVETVRRLACDASVDLVLEQEGRPVGIGRAGRLVPPWLRRLLVHRDRGRCRFPGCESERWVDAHHIRHWGDGGPTDLDNLVLLCDAHHRLIHEGGWRIAGHPAWVLRFHDPGGRPLVPPDLQPDLLAAGFG